jgi:hypothetical protein
MVPVSDKIHISLYNIHFQILYISFEELNRIKVI